MWLVILIVLGILCGCLLLSIAVGFDNAMLLVWFFRLAWIVPLASFAIALIAYAWPRKGALYAYKNWLMGWALSTVGVTMAVLFVPVFLFPATGRDLGQAGIWVLTLSGCLFLSASMLISWPILVPAFGLRRLRRKFPQVIGSIRRYRKPGESRGQYFPMLVMDGRSYFPVTYNNFSGATVAGLLVLDEQGEPVRDKGRMHSLGRCYRLALATIDGRRQFARIGEVVREKSALGLLQRGTSVLREPEGYFHALGEQGLQAVSEILSTEAALRTEMELRIARETMEAEWGAERGNQHMVEVRYEELLELEKRMQDLLLPCYENASLFVRASQAAEKLLGIIETEGDAVVRGYQRYNLRQRDDVKRFLTTLVRFGNRVAAQGDHYEFPGFSATEWLAWSHRLEWADRVEGGRRP